MRAVHLQRNRFYEDQKAVAARRSPPLVEDPAESEEKVKKEKGEEVGLGEKLLGVKHELQTAFLFADIRL